jgi:hypothetical protein
MDVAASPTRSMTCGDHPDRPAHARCMTCRKVLCDECATTWDGINYCSRCLQARGSAPRGGGAWLGSAVLLLVIGGLAFVHSQVLLWVGGLLAYFF